MRDTKEKTVTGLTTAATVWVTAALGIACGLAAWQIVGLSMALAIFLLVGVAWIESVFDKSDGYN